MAVSPGAIAPSVNLGTVHPQLARALRIVRGSSPMLTKRNSASTDPRFSENAPKSCDSVSHDATGCADAADTDANMAAGTIIDLSFINQSADGMTRPFSVSSTLRSLPFMFVRTVARLSNSPLIPRVVSLIFISEESPGAIGFGSNSGFVHPHDAETVTMTRGASPVLVNRKVCSSVCSDDFMLPKSCTVSSNLTAGVFCRRRMKLLHRKRQQESI